MIPPHRGSAMAATSSRHGMPSGGIAFLDAASLRPHAVATVPVGAGAMASGGAPGKEGSVLRKARI